MKVLFWGTPEFALPTLDALEDEGHHVVGVVTQPDRPKGRGRKMAPSPVSAFAEAEGYEVFKPDRPRGDEFVGSIRALGADISVVVAYGHILVREVLDVPELGSINVHASLLPKLRGAAPINWALVRGFDETGVTVMRMVEAMDAGPILAQQTTPISPEDNARVLGRRLAELGAITLVETLALMEAGLVQEVDQDDAEATYAPKLNRETARIDWNQDAPAVADLIRGMDDVPGAWTTLDGEPVKLFRPAVKDGGEVGPPGTVLLADQANGLLVATRVGEVSIGEVQPPGKRRMEAVQWIQGRGVQVGDRFE
ncbi:MAG: methionyl-tRNA formyltransferase [Longimicrobiales bacterium]